jgi:DNA-binding MarR family transcriptional regulator
MRILEEIGRDPRVSQRALGRVAGLSAAMVNAYVDDLVARGCVEVVGDTNRTYRYYLTPEGCRRRDGLRAELAAEVEALRASGLGLMTG